jgi:HEAT repeat protein
MVLAPIGFRWRAGSELLQGVALRFFPAHRITATELYIFLRHERVGKEENGWFGTLGKFDPLGAYLSRVQIEGSSIEKKLCDFGVLESIGAGENNAFMFLHLTFQEFLVAKALAAKGWRPIAGFVDQMAWLPEWREVILMLAGVMAKPDALLRCLSDPKRDDSLRCRSVLAALAYPEIEREQVRDLADERDALMKSFIEMPVWTDPEANVLIRDYNEAVSGLVTAGAQYEGVDLPFHIIASLRNPQYDRYNRLKALPERICARLGSGAASPAVLEAFRELLQDDKTNLVRKEAAEVLGGFGSAAATPEIILSLASMLEAEDSSMDYSAAHALAAFGASAASPKMIAILTRMLLGKSEHQRRVAMRVVGHLGDVAATSEMLKILVGLWSRGRPDPFYHFRRTASVPRVLRLLLSMIQTANSDERLGIVEAIRCFGPMAAVPEVISILPDMLSDEDERVRCAAAETVRPELGAAAAIPSVVAALDHLLDDEVSFVRESAARAIARLGIPAVTPRARLALPQMILDKQAEGVVRSLIRALDEEAGTPEVLALLPRLLRDEDLEVSRYAMRLIGEIGRSAATAEIIEVLDGLLDDFLSNNRNHDSSAAAAAAIGYLGQAVPAHIIRKLFRMAGVHLWGIGLSALTSLRLLASKNIYPKINVVLTQLPGYFFCEDYRCGEIEIYDFPKSRFYNDSGFIHREVTKFFSNITNMTRWDVTQISDHLCKHLHDPMPTNQSTALSIISLIGPAAATEEILAAVAGCNLAPFQRYELARRLNLRFFALSEKKTRQGGSPWIIRLLRDLSGGGSRPFEYNVVRGYEVLTGIGAECSSTRAGYDQRSSRRSNPC